MVIRRLLFKMLVNAPYQVEIFSINGQKVSTISSTSIQNTEAKIEIDLSNQLAGIYLFRLTNEYGSFVQKVLLQ